MCAVTLYRVKWCSGVNCVNVCFVGVVAFVRCCTTYYARCCGVDLLCCNSGRYGRECVA